MKNKPITSTQLEFIFENLGKMKQTDMASVLKVHPVSVCRAIKGRRKQDVVMDGYFDIDREYKMFYKY